MTPHPPRERRRHRLVAAAGCALLPLTACGTAEDDAPLEDPSSEIVGGAVGPDAEVTDDITLEQVQLEYPLDSVYEEGEDARLFFAVTNTASEPARLVDISGPDFADVRVERSDGAGFPLEVDENDNLYVGAEGPPDVMLVDLDRSLRSSQSIPVTFTFAEAGEVTIDVVVSSEDQTPAPPYDFPDDDADQDPTGDDATGSGD